MVGKKNLKLFIIAGEASGDIIGGGFLKEFLKRYPDTKISGIGGDVMLNSGLCNSLFDMKELSIMGIAEILPKIPKLITRINQTVKAIEEFEPDIILTIDAPDFSFRVQNKVKNRSKIKSFQVHYVAPTVWAWRSGRAKKISHFLDMMLCLFPFEPEFFIKEGMKAECVGHPMIDSGILDAKPYNNIEGKVVGFLLGSRKGEIARMAGVYKDIIGRLYEYDRNMTILMPTLPHLKELIAEIFKDMPNKIKIVANNDKKWSYFKRCDAAVATSGTVGLELAMCGVPHIIGYKMNSISFNILKRFVKVKYAHLVNIMFDREVVPEFIQDKCNTNNMYDAVIRLIEDKEAVKKQKKDFALIIDKIKGANGSSPSCNAVDAILKSI